MRGQTLVSFVRGILGTLALGHVVNYGDATDDLVLLISQRRVMTFKETLTTAFRHQVRSVVRSRGITFKRRIEIFVRASLFQKRKDLERAFAQYVLAFHAGYLFHRLIPGGVTTLAVKRKNAFDARFEQLLQEEFALYRLYIHRLLDHKMCRDLREGRGAVLKEILIEQMAGGKWKKKRL